MKKTVKSLIIAASVAAIAGIGAVSFAAWNGANTTVSTEENSFGQVTLVGFKDTTPITADNKLVPYDQTEGYNATNHARMVAFALPDVEAAGKVKITVTAETEIEGALYVQLTKTAPTAPDGTDESVPAGWKEIDGTASVFNFNSATDATGLTAYVILDSEENGDMAGKYTLTFTLEEVAE